MEMELVKNGLVWYGMTCGVDCFCPAFLFWQMANGNGNGDRDCLSACKHHQQRKAYGTINY